MKNIPVIACFCVLAINTSRAGTTNEYSAPAAPATPASTRYGLFHWLDNRSMYGQDVFPEPFLVDDSDLEAAEARLDWLHTGANSSHSDVFKAEVEKGIGLMTLELEVPYEYDRADGETSQGFDNIDVGARYPIYQFVSPSGSFDTTFGAGIELGIPTTSEVSHNTELVPKIFNDTKIDNFTVQSIFGYSMLYGPGDDGGVNTFEYGFVFGYNILPQVLAVPGVDKIIPVAELSGETQLNKDDSGQTSLTADVGLRVNLKTIGRIQPRPGVVFVFPLNRNSRDEQHWGIMTSLVFEF